MNNYEYLEKLKKWLNESYELTNKYKKEGRLHREYYRGRQLDADTLDILAERGQPESWVNLYQMIGNKVIGYKIDTRTEVKVIGRQYTDRETGQILSDILRSFTDSPSLDGTFYYNEKNECDLDLMLYGLSAMEVKLKLTGEIDEDGRYLKEVEFARIDADEIFTDPFDKTKNYAKSRYVHRVFWVNKEELYPRYGADVVDTFSTGTDFVQDYSYDTESVLSANSEPRVCLHYTWFKEYDKEKQKKVVKFAVWTNDTVLEVCESPFTHDGFPIKVCRLFAGENGEFYGMFRNLHPLQDTINYATLRLTNMLGSSKLIIESGAVDDIETFKRDFSKDNSVVMVEAGAISKGQIKEINQADRIVQIQQRIHELMQQAKTVAGFNEEALGVAVNRLSGYAIEQRQRTGLMGMMHYIDASTAFDASVFGFAIDMVVQFFDAEQIFYIIDASAEQQNFAINGASGAKLNVGRYDTIVNFVPIEAGSRAERYKQNTELMRVVGQFAPGLVPKLLPEFLKDSDAPLANRIQKAIAEFEEENKQNSNGVVQQLQQKKIELDLGEQQANIQLSQAKAAEAAMKAATAQAGLDGQPNGVVEGV